MIYVTGDTHGEASRYFDINMNDSGWTESDYLIICGDFGYADNNNAEKKAILDSLEKKPYTICFCDGNHENFDELYAYPEEEWKGGRIHRIRKNIVHLMRGQVFVIDGKKFFSMGGAYSVDRGLRRLGYSYWAEEIPSSEEIYEAYTNLSKNGNEVDIIITHTAPPSIMHKLGGYPMTSERALMELFMDIMKNVRFKRWYFGHWHQDMDIEGYDGFKTVFTEFYAVEDEL